MDHDEDAKPLTPGAPSGQVSRRFFLGQLPAAGVAVSAAPLLRAGAAAAAPQSPDAASALPGLRDITLQVNGKAYKLRLETRVTLLDCLREHLHLTGTKKGCDHGQCGACTVHVNGRRINSCLSFAVMHTGDQITTIEGVGTPERLHPMQQAFVDHDGFQCGYCTPGQIMSAVALLKEPCGAGDAEVREAMSGNICRCGAYRNIVAAIQQVRQNRA